MATQSGVFKFALPEDELSDQLRIYSCATKTGTYSLDTTVDYEYGDSTYEYDSLDDTKWYKIQFNNSTDSETGPLSDPVYGGNFSQASPFLAVSTGTDGAQYATTQDVYDYSTLTTSDVTTARVSQALRRARSIVDLRTAELDLDRFTQTFDSGTSRKKFNATLRIVREAEINIALGYIYRGIADDIIARKMREALAGGAGDGSIAIGDARIGAEGSLSDTTHVNALLDIANRYMTTGGAILSSIQPPSIRLHATPDNYVNSPRFKYPFNGY